MGETVAQRTKAWGRACLWTWALQLLSLCSSPFYWTRSFGVCPEVWEAKTRQRSLSPYCTVTGTFVPPTPHTSSSSSPSELQRLGQENYRQLHHNLSWLASKEKLSQVGEERGKTQKSPCCARWISHLICTKQNCWSHLILYQRQKLWQQRHVITS